MGTVKNISADTRFVPLIDRQLEPGESVDVDDALLDPKSYAWDPDVWDVTGGDPRKLSELKTEAEARGLPTSGTKRDLVERIAAHDAEHANDQPADPTVASSTDETNGE